MIKLIVNDVELDLRSDTVVALTKKSVDIGNLQNRWSSYTNKFVVPATKKNRDALGIKQFQDASGSQYDYQNGKLISGGLEIASNVLVIIEQVSKDITLTLRAGNGTLFDALNKTKLSDLYWDDLNHTWTESVIKANRNNSYTSGYIYPIFQSGAQSIFNNTIIGRGLYPWIFVKAAFERIASNFGYTFQGDTYTNNLFENISYPIASLKNDPTFFNTYSFNANFPSQGPKDNIKPDYVTVSGTYPLGFINMPTINDSFYKYTSGINLSVVIDAKNSYTSLQNNPSRSLGPDYGYGLYFNGTYKIEINYDITYGLAFPFGDPNRKLDIVIILWDKKNQSATTVNSIATTQSPANSLLTTSGTRQYFFTFTNIDPTFVKRYVIFPALRHQGYNVVNVNSGYFKVDIEPTGDNESKYGTDIQIKNAQPDITCGAFIKEIGNIFGAIYDVDEFKKTIEITRLDEIAANKAIAYDWSDKLDLNQPINVVFKLDGIGKVTVLRWSQDDIKYAKSLTVNNDQLPEKIDYIKSGIPYPNVEYALKLANPIINISSYSNNNVVLDGQFRIGILKSNTDVNQNLIYPEAPSTTTNSYKFAYFSDTSFTESLDFNELYNDYYADLLDPMTSRLQVVECYMKLNDLDIQKFRFKYPVYIKHFNRYFFVNEIAEYTGKTQSTKVVLVGI